MPWQLLSKYKVRQDQNKRNNKYRNVTTIKSLCAFSTSVSIQNNLCVLVSNTIEIISFCIIKFI